jgi:hypothetical protein
LRGDTALSVKRYRLLAGNIPFLNDRKRRHIRAAGLTASWDGWVSVVLLVIGIFLLLYCDGQAGGSLCFGMLMKKSDGHGARFLGLGSEGMIGT